MPTAISRADHVWVVIRWIPPGDPAAHGIQEPEGWRSIWVAGVLMGLGHFSPGATPVGAVDDDVVPSTSITLGANRPHILAVHKLNPPQPSGDLAS